jgi:hypothetical protein
LRLRFRRRAIGEIGGILTKFRQVKHRPYMFHNISYANRLSDVDGLGAANPCSASPNAGHQAPADAARVVGIAGQFGLKDAVFADGAVEQERHLVPVRGEPIRSAPKG